MEFIEIQHIKKYFPYTEGLRRRQLRAADDISLKIQKGETLGLVGESGCGKSTLGRVILRLLERTEGSVFFQGKDIFAMKHGALLQFRRDAQIVFQDPYACLNPRLTVEQIISEPLRFHGMQSKTQRAQRVREVMRDVGLPEEMSSRYPHELSGGQQQRVGIARALVLRPKFIVCDEAVSALDVSVQAQIMNLLVRLKEEYDLTYLFISHNLAVIHHLCDKIAVMYLGKIVELADKETLFREPLHPYTQALMEAVLTVDDAALKRRQPIVGDMPNPAAPPQGCYFHPRCRQCESRCRQAEPKLIEVTPGHWVACLRAPLEE